MVGRRAWTRRCARGTDSSPTFRGGKTRKSATPGAEQLADFVSGNAALQTARNCGGTNRNCRGRENDRSTDVFSEALRQCRTRSARRDVVPRARPQGEGSGAGAAQTVGGVEGATSVAGCGAHVARRRRAPALRLPTRISELLRVRPKLDNDPEDGDDVQAATQLRRGHSRLSGAVHVGANVLERSRPFGAGERLRAAQIRSPRSARVGIEVHGKAEKLREEGDGDARDALAPRGGVARYRASTRHLSHHA
jgi:hypothetical protein